MTDVALSNYIEGRWQEPALALPRAVCDANDGRELFAQRASSPEQIERALQRATATHADNAWLKQGAEQRAADLNRVAEEVLKRAEAIAVADSQATGVVISLTRKFVQVCAGAFRQAAQLVAQPPAIGF